MSSRWLTYEYAKLDEGERQYDSIDLNSQVGVPARYVRTSSDTAGNPFIEALPKPRDKDELNLAGAKGITGYAWDEEQKKDDYEKILDVSRLKEIRFPLPCNHELEYVVYMALVNSYRDRKIMRDEDLNLTFESRNQIQRTDGILVGRESGMANAGFSLIGFSGCGKSSALETLFSNYPQYIIHKGPGLTTYPQIVYLIVQCPPHSNFRALYRGIGLAIDRALGNIKPVYANVLDAGERGNLGLYTGKLRELIERFGIGIIVFDEIQHLNFDSKLENSFEAILELVNETGVAFGVVGTEDSYSKIFAGNLRQSRRLGTEIVADSYCRNKQIFTYITKRLFAYQWFGDTMVEPTPEIIDTLYKLTKGIIDQLISVYMWMNIDYIRATKKPVVNADYIEKTMKKHFSGMMELLNDMDTTSREDRRMEIMQKASDELSEIAKEERANRANKAVMGAYENGDNERMMEARNFVVSRVMELNESIQEDTITKLFNKVVLSKAGKEALQKGNVEILRLIMQKLDKAGKNPSDPNISATKIRSYIFDEEDTKQYQ